jgi:hypothetical protein
VWDSTIQACSDPSFTSKAACTFEGSDSVGKLSHPEDEDYQGETSKGCISWNYNKKIFPWVRDEGLHSELRESTRPLCDYKAKVNESSNTCDAGMVYLFKRNQGGDNKWGQVVAIKLGANVGQRSDRFGSSVSLSGNYLAVGCATGVPIAAYSDGTSYTKRTPGGRSRSSSLPYSGAVFLYEKNQGGSDAWGLLTELVDEYSGAIDMLGVSDSVDAGA